jgi:hypothetical protein
MAVSFKGARFPQEIILTGVRWYGERLILGESLEVLAPLQYPPPMEHAFTAPHVYQFRVVVQGISPLIWRRLLIRSDMSLATLHATLQIVLVVLNRLCCNLRKIVVVG